jgi:hypothetical protein
MYASTAIKTDRKVLSYANNRFLRIFLAETLGTFLLVLLGDAAVAQVPTFLFFLLFLIPKYVRVPTYTAPETPRRRIPVASY